MYLLSIVEVWLDIFINPTVWVRQIDNDPALPLLRFRLRHERAGLIPGGKLGSREGAGHCHLFCFLGEVGIYMCFISLRRGVVIVHLFLIDRATCVLYRETIPNSVHQPLVLVVTGTFLQPGRVVKVGGEIDPCSSIVCMAALALKPFGP